MFGFFTYDKRTGCRVGRTTYISEYQARMAVQELKNRVRQYPRSSRAALAENVGIVQVTERTKHAQRGERVI